jgi:hypothetical protein
VRSLRPLFLFSLPRSGSTLVQRVLASHPAIATKSETWLLLPLLYALRDRGIYAEYDHAFARSGLKEFLEAVPEKAAAYRDAVRLATIELYGRASPPEAQYFLDKTPRYSLIADEVLETFPDAAAVVLWRNPLAVAASMIETWGSGRWNLFKFKVDLYSGLRRLLEVTEEFPNRVLQVRYEDLVRHPETSWERIFTHLNLEYEASILERFHTTRLAGSMGDPTGTQQYNSLSTEPVDKWRKTFASPVRKSWARSYLSSVGNEGLRRMGYDQQGLIQELNDIPYALRSVPSDLWYKLYGIGYHLLEAKQVRLKIGQVFDPTHLYAHR